MTNLWDISEDLKKVFAAAEPHPIRHDMIFRFAMQANLLFCKRDFNEGDIEHCLGLYPYDSIYNATRTKHPKDTADRMDYTFQKTVVGHFEALFFQSIFVRNTSMDVLKCLQFLSEHCPDKRSQIAKAACSFNGIIAQIHATVPDLFENIDTFYDGTSGLTPEYDAFLDRQSPPFTIAPRRISDDIPLYLLKKIDNLNDAIDGMINIQSTMVINQIAFFTHALQHGYYNGLSFLGDSSDRTLDQSHDLFRAVIQDGINEIIKVRSEKCDISICLAELASVFTNPALPAPRRHIK